MGTVEFRIKEVAREKGVENAYQLQQQTGLPYAICHRFFNQPTHHISATTLAKLCDGLGVTPSSLITYTVEAGKDKV